MNKKIRHSFYITGFKLKNKLWGTCLCRQVYPILALFVCFAVFSLFWWTFKATTLFAADPLTYELLANDIPGLTGVTKPTEYLAGMVKVIIGIITALSVLMMVYAGVFGYIGGATSPSTRSAAKTQMWGALLGLTLALASYIILNTINPDLLSLDLTLP